MAIQSLGYIVSFNLYLSSKMERKSPGRIPEGYRNYLYVHQYSVKNQIEQEKNTARDNRPAPSDRKPDKAVYVVKGSVLLTLNIILNIKCLTSSSTSFFQGTGGGLAKWPKAPVW